jgi:hypothetical protein
LARFTGRPATNSIGTSGESEQGEQQSGQGGVTHGAHATRFSPRPKERSALTKCVDGRAACDSLRAMFAAVHRCLWVVALNVSFSSCGEPPGSADQVDATADADAAVSTVGRDGATMRPPRTIHVDSACVAQSVRAQRKRRPVDAVFVIDNSGSMSDEIAAVRSSINDDFAAVIDESGIDLRVILISRYGSGGTFICVEPPLAGAPCERGVAETNGPRFFHYDLEIGSHDALCYLLASFDQPDQAERAPEGWKQWLRPDASKAFVVVTDDSPRCAYREANRELAFGASGSPEEDALLFHQTLLRKAPEQFGVPPDTRYRFFSIVGMAESGAPGSALLPHLPLEPRTCDTAMSSGLVYQAISTATDALRYPVCEGRSFDRVFEVLARSVVESSSADCTFDIPEESADGVPIDPATINLRYQPSRGESRQFVQVAKRDACNDSGSFYIEANMQRIQLCPTACTMVKRDEAPSVQLYYGCEILVQ